MNNELISTELPSLKRDREHDLQTIKERLQSGFYDNEEILEELATNLMETGVLETDVNLQQKSN